MLEVARPAPLRAGAPGGLRVRRAVPGDRAALAAMFGRCSLETRYRRFHAPVHKMPERYLAAALAGRPDHYALVAAAPSGAITALASACATEPGTMEVGILVEDSWQGRGLGGFLLGRLVRHARRRGVGVIAAVILREQAWILRLLRAHGDCETTSSREATFATLLLHAPSAWRPSVLAALGLSGLACGASR